MPPKAFKPPLSSFPPSNPQSKPKYQSSTSKSTKTTKSTISKSKRESPSNVKAAKAAKTSAAARRVLELPSLSPDSSPAEGTRVNEKGKGKTNNEKEKRRESLIDVDEEEANASDDEDEEEDEDSGSSPVIVRKTKTNPKPKPKPKSKQPSSSPEPSSTQDRKQQIPPPLISMLLHTFLAEQGKERIRISKDANKAVGVYLDTFVREAVARAAWERGERLDGGGDGGSLEVEDLERLGPQLLMDF